MKINNSNKNYKFKYEIKFYHHADKSRIEKIINHYELTKLTKNVKGDIVELGVFKGTSLLRFAHFRDILNLKNKIFGFDTFTSFPKNTSKNTYDRVFPKNFKKIAGSPLNVTELNKIIYNKNLKNIFLIKGNIFKTLDQILEKKIKISLLHLDLDTEEITNFALTKLYSCISKGGIIVLDDYKIHKGIDRAIKNFKIAKLKVRKPIFGTNPHYIIKNQLFSQR